MKTTLRPEKMWAVHHPSIGFYVGTALTRRDIIKQHVSALGHDWQYHHAKGDRVIRVLVTPA